MQNWENKKIISNSILMAIFSQNIKISGYKDDVPVRMMTITD
jgi:hypothetical protein